jgi:hypothetical protein
MDIFEQATEKRNQLLASFEKLPEITLYGVVGANGPSGCKMPPEEQWTLNLVLIAWRIPGAPVQRSKLVVSKAVSAEELGTLQDSISHDSLIAFHGILCENSPFGDARAQFVCLLDQPVDEALELVLSQYQEPVEIRDPFIGKLVLNKSVDWFEGKVTWLGKEVDIAISVDEKGTASDSIQTAQALLTSMEGWASKVRDYAVAELLEVKNENWLEEEECPLSRDEFISRMQLTSITVFPGGVFEFWHDDGDLFWGHSIHVSGTLSEGITNVDIAG